MRNLAKLWYAGIFTQNKSQNCDVKLVLPQHFLPAHVYPGRLLPMLQLSFQSSFWTSPRIQETYFRWAPCSERRSDQEVEGEEDVQVGRKHWWSFIWRCSSCQKHWWSFIWRCSSCQKHLFAEPGTQLWAPMRESSSTGRWIFSGNVWSSVLWTLMINIARMANAVQCQKTKIVMNSGSQVSEL